MSQKQDYDVFAEFYDAIFKEGREDEDFYLEKAEETDGRVLEIACGTGRLYLKMLERGIDAYGFDFSEGMLERLKEKAEEKGLEPKVRKSDMRDFEYDKKFSLIMIPFRSFLNNRTSEDKLKTLEQIRKHLKPDGRLVLNFFSPDFEMVADFGDKEKQITRDGEDYKVKFHNRLVDGVEMIVKTEREIFNSKGGKEGSFSVEISMVTKQEFEALLEAAGFSDWKVYSGFDEKELSEEQGQELVWEVEK